MRLLDTGKASPQKNMDCDRELLSRIADEKEGILHFYEWDCPSATYGHFIRPQQHLDLEGVEKHSLSLARRPTGGGLIFHTCDFAFSLLLPSSHPDISRNSLENYAFVNRKAAEAVRRFLGKPPVLLQQDRARGYDKNIPFCMANPTVFDLLIEGKKVGGAAQRRTREGLLHQGSISLTLPERDLLEAVLRDGGLIESMRQNSWPLLGEIASCAEVEEAKVSLRRCFLESFVS